MNLPGILDEVAGGATTRLLAKGCAGYCDIGRNGAFSAKLGQPITFEVLVNLFAGCAPRSDFRLVWGQTPGKCARCLFTASARPSKVSLQRMRRIVDLNAYRLCASIGEYVFKREGEAELTEIDRHGVYGLFPLGSLVNHACTVNVSKVLLNDWVFLRAARDIAPGEELFQHYCDIRAPLSVRQKELSDLFGFTCVCPRCRFEAEVPPRSLPGVASLWTSICDIYLVSKLFGINRVDVLGMQLNLGELSPTFSPVGSGRQLRIPHTHIQSPTLFMSTDNACPPRRLPRTAAKSARGSSPPGATPRSPHHARIRHPDSATMPRG